METATALGCIEAEVDGVEFFRVQAQLRKGAEAAGSLQLEQVRAAMDFSLWKRWEWVRVGDEVVGKGFIAASEKQIFRSAQDDNVIWVGFCKVEFSEEW